MYKWKHTDKDFTIIIRKDNSVKISGILLSAFRYIIKMPYNPIKKLILQKLQIL